MPDGLLVLKLDFRLRRVDIDIDVRRCHLKVYKIRYVRAYWNQTFVGLRDSLMEISMLHVASINEEALVDAFLAGCLGFGGEAGNLTEGRFYIDG